MSLPPSGTSPRKCQVAGCTFTHRHVKIFFRLPRARHVFEKWIQLSGKKELLSVPLDILRANVSFCHNHFVNIKGGVARRRISRHAVPVVFPEGHVPLSDEDMNRWRASPGYIHYWRAIDIQPMGPSAVLLRCPNLPETSSAMYCETNGPFSCLYCEGKPLYSEASEDKTDVEDTSSVSNQQSLQSVRDFDDLNLCSPQETKPDQKSSHLGGDAPEKAVKNSPPVQPQTPWTPRQVLILTRETPTSKPTQRITTISTLPGPRKKKRKRVAAPPPPSADVNTEVPPPPVQPSSPSSGCAQEADTAFDTISTSDSELDASLLPAKIRASGTSEQLPTSSRIENAVSSITSFAGCPVIGGGGGVVSFQSATAKDLQAASGDWKKKYVITRVGENLVALPFLTSKIRGREPEEEKN